MSQNDLPLATIISHNDIPNRISWDAVVEKALQIIWGKSYECVKVIPSNYEHTLFVFSSSYELWRR